MGLQVHHTLFQGGDVLGRELRLGHAAVVLQGPDSSHHHHAGRGQPRHAALDVQELLSPQVRAEPGLGDAVIPQLQGQAGGPHGVAPVGDVGEGPAVHNGGGALDGLHQVGVHRVPEQGGHGPVGLDVPGVHRLAVVGVGDEHVPQPLFQVFHVL